MITKKRKKKGATIFFVRVPHKKTFQHLSRKRPFSKVCTGERRPETDKKEVLRKFFLHICTSCPNKHGDKNFLKMCFSKESRLWGKMSKKFLLFAVSHKQKKRRLYQHTWEEKKDCQPRCFFCVFFLSLHGDYTAVGWGWEDVVQQTQEILNISGVFKTKHQYARWVVDLSVAKYSHPKPTNTQQKKHKAKLKGTDKVTSIPVHFFFSFKMKISDPHFILNF